MKAFNLNGGPTNPDGVLPEKLSLEMERVIGSPGTPDKIFLPDDWYAGDVESIQSRQFKTGVEVSQDAVVGFGSLLSLCQYIAQNIGAVTLKGVAKVLGGPIGATTLWYSFETMYTWNTEFYITPTPKRAPQPPSSQEQK